MDLTPISGIRTGSLVSTGAAAVLNLLWVPDYFELYNVSQASFAGTPAAVKKAVWFPSLASGTSIVTKNTATAATDETSLLSVGGITPFDSYTGIPYSAVAMNAISQASPAVVTTGSAHGLVTGDTVRLWGATGLTQLNGRTFTVTVLSGTTFSVNVDTSSATSFPALGAGGFVQKLFPGAGTVWQPRNVIVTGISQASAAVVQTSAAHGYTTGDFVRLYVPSTYGMVQANTLLVKVTAIPTSTSFTTDLNTSAFTAFKWPAQTSGQAKVQYAQAVPVGETALDLDNPKLNNAVRGLFLGTGVVGAASDVLQWIAYKATT